MSFPTVEDTATLAQRVEEINRRITSPTENAVLAEAADRLKRLEHELAAEVKQVSELCGEVVRLTLLYDEGVKAISELQRAWIPVAVRAPKGQYDVLVTDGKIVGIGDCCKGRLWNSPTIDGVVTHWMPLPDTPK